MSISKTANSCKSLGFKKGRQSDILKLNSVRNLSADFAFSSESSNNAYPKNRAELGQQISSYLIRKIGN